MEQPPIEGRAAQVLWAKPTAGGGWWNTPAMWRPTAMSGRTVSSVGVEPIDGEVPGSFALDQNYPNPFNPTTAIRFNLPQAADVHLTVYNVLGQQVATLINGEAMAPGAYTYDFDARDLASGLYLYRLEAGAFTQTRTMMLIK